MSSERWLVTGASGQLGGHVLRRLAEEAGPPRILALAGRGEVGVSGVDVARVDLRDLGALRRTVAEFRPTHVAHIGALTAVADAYSQPADALLINAAATAALAESADACAARFVFTSTDMVFAGDAAPYDETSATDSVTHYGRTKIAAELALRRFPAALAVRIPLMYGLAVTPRETTFTKQLAALRAGETLRMFVDEFRTPVWLPDAAAALIALARSPVQGVIHVAGPERLSRLEMIERVAAALGIRAAVEPISRLSIAGPEPRPADLSLRAKRFAAMFPALAPRPIGPHVFAAP